MWLDLWWKMCCSKAKCSLLYTLFPLKTFTGKKNFLLVESLILRGQHRTSGSEKAGSQPVKVRRASSEPQWMRKTCSSEWEATHCCTSSKSEPVLGTTLRALSFPVPWDWLQNTTVSLFSARTFRILLSELPFLPSVQTPLRKSGSLPHPWHDPWQGRSFSSNMKLRTR